MPASPLHQPVVSWFSAHGRDLPWRARTATAWGVLVSEMMLQQTPVARVEPAWTTWMARWPAPADLAADTPGEAVRAWGRLGYPRRALRLHETAVALTGRHGGDVPDDLEALLRLPGVGSYTAAAVAAFAFGRRAAVVDTNVRRVLARVVTGDPGASGATTASDVRTATALLPDDDREAALWSVAVMELGALVCTARAPRCDTCPVASSCAWRAAGRPAPERAASAGQHWAGTDRQARGRLLAALRDAREPVPVAALAALWPDDVQRVRCLDSLVADGLAEAVGADRLGLPSGRPG